MLDARYASSAADSEAGAQVSPMTAAWALGTAAGRIQAELSSSGPPVIAVDLGATHTRVAITGPGGFERLIIKRTADLPRVDGQGVVPGVLAMIHEAIDSSAFGTPPVAIGVAVAAYVDPSGVILQHRPFGIPAGGAVRDGLSAAFGIPVVVDNDANLAVAAEVAVGAGRGLRNVALITLGTNIGLGIVADGRIIRGAHGAAGEAGALLVPARRGRDGRAGIAWAGRLGHGETSAPAGYALLEELVGGGALLTSIDSEVVSRMRSSDRVDGNMAPGIFPRAAAGDRKARLAVRHAIEGWAMLIADLVALFDPEAFVLAGGLVGEAASFIDPLRRRAADLCWLPPEIRVGDLGAQSGLVGAAVAARSVLQASVRAKPAGTGSI